MLDNLDKYEIILCSKSPRRRELLSQLGVTFRVRVLEGIKENYPSDLPVYDIAPYLSRLKAGAYKDVIEKDQLVITADTVVICEDKILGKPRNIREACEMLAFLSGKTHTVVTGVTVMNDVRSETISVATSVTFSHLTKEEIEYYVGNFRPLDKAGAYGIQEWIGGVAVEKINGSFYNVMGLPIHQLYKLLLSF